MEENKKPVENTPEAGQGEGVKKTEGEEPEGQPAPIDTQAIAEVLELSDAALKKAEDKIVALKRKIKSGEGGEEDEDLRDQIT